MFAGVGKGSVKWAGVPGMRAEAWLLKDCQTPVACVGCVAERSQNLPVPLSRMKMMAGDAGVDGQELLTATCLVHGRVWGHLPLP